MPPSILLTRPLDASRTLRTELAARLGPDCTIVTSPLLSVMPTGSGLPDRVAGTLIFTSAHAVTFFAEASAQRDVRCYTVGPATAEAARAAGFDPISGEGTGRALADRIIADRPPTPCLYLRGDHVALDIADALNTAGLATQSHVIYRQIPEALTPEARQVLAGRQEVIVPLYSPRSAELFFAQGPFRAPLAIAAISDNVARLVPKNGRHRCLRAASPDQPAVVDTVCDLWVTANRLERDDPAQ